MYGIPVRYLLIGASVVFLIAVLGLHIRGDNKMREQIIDLQVDLRTSENNYITCESLNKANAEKAREQQASIDRFAGEQQAAIDQANRIAQELQLTRQQNDNQAKQIRQQAREALQISECASTAIPARALVLLNNAIDQASID